MKTLGNYSACGLLNVLYASFSMTAPLTLAHIDPLIFTAFQFVLLIPLAGFLVWRYRGACTRLVLINGLAIGSCLGAGFLLIALALRSVGITESAVLSCANGVLAVLVGWRVFHQRITKLTWLACLCAVLGAVFLGVSVPLRWQGDLTAFCGGSLFTLSTFLWEHFLSSNRQAKVFWPVMGVQILTMAGLVALLALCFGEWNSLASFQPLDGGVLLYTSIGATLAPTLLSSWIQLQKRASAITIAFFAILDPLLCAVFAFFVVGERLPWLAYIGAAGVVLSLVLQALAAAQPAPSRVKVTRELPLLEHQPVFLSEEKRAALETAPSWLTLTVKKIS